VGIGRSNSGELAANVIIGARTLDPAITHRPAFEQRYTFGTRLAHLVERAARPHQDVGLARSVCLAGFAGQSWERDCGRSGHVRTSPATFTCCPPAAAIFTWSAGNLR